LPGPWDQIDKQIEAKLTRQDILGRESAPRLAAVLDEAALRRLAGGRHVMAAHLARLLDVAARPNVSVQVLPFAAGSHPGLESNFTILALPGQAPDVVFVEGLIGPVYLDRAEDLKRYREIFCKLQSMALNSQDTAALIAGIVRSYKDGTA
jgi:hypothetical protein